MTNDHKTPQKLFPVLLKAGALGAAILLGFLLGVLVGDRDRRRPKEETPAKDTLAVAALADTLQVDTTAIAAPVEEPAQEEPEADDAYKPSRKEIAAGVEYLATHNRWNRDEMEKLPALRGLWDAVNTYQLDEIKRYNDVLSSTPLITIVEGLEKSPKRGYYASRNDHVITLSTYIKRLR